MEDKLLDKLVYHLAQLNFEECHSLLEGVGLSELKNALFMLVSFDVYYFRMDYVQDDDALREELFAQIEAIVHPALMRQGDHVFDQLYLCLRTRQQAISLYIDLIKSEVLSDRSISQCRSLLETLESVQDYTLEPYQKAFQQELRVLLKLLEAQMGLSEFNYLVTMVSLKEANMHLNMWEDVFVHKRYTPLLRGKTATTNEVHRWLFGYFNTLIGKASLYFGAFQDGIKPKEGSLASLKIEGQCWILKVDIFALLLDVSDVNIRRKWEEQGYRCPSDQDIEPHIDSQFQNVYIHKRPSETLPPEIEKVLLSMVRNEVHVPRQPVIKKDQEMDYTFYAAQVDLHLYAVLAHVNKSHSETAKIREFFTTVCQQLYRSTPCYVPKQ